MKKKTITSFIHSKNRVASDKVYDFVVDYPDGIISCKDNEYIELNVVSFDMLNNMYNINSTNNCLKVNGTLTYIPHGNYSVKTFRTMLLSFCRQERQFCITKHKTHIVLPEREL